MRIKRKRKGNQLRMTRRTIIGDEERGAAGTLGGGGDMEQADGVHSIKKWA